jgi:serine/threonine protein phosphatase PrpC
MKRTFAFGAATSQGSWPVQEDGYFADPGSGLFALADGFGGRGAGDLSAKLALQEVRGLQKANLAPKEGASISPAQWAQRELFLEINKKILLRNEKRPVGGRGGCSLILAVVERERELTVTSCGSCSAVLVRNGAWISLLSAQASPRLDFAEPLFPSQALGLGRELSAESRSFTLARGDLVLLLSGGLAGESGAFQAELLAQVAVREPGTALGSLTAFATTGFECPWNRTAVALEALP